MTDTTTALAFVLPDEFRNDVNTIRVKYDKAVNRWPPHINFLFPFVSVSEFETIKSRLELLKLIGSFDINFNTLGFFSQGKGNITFHLKLDDDSEKKFQEIFKQIRKELPEIQVKRPDFHPHLTLGQCKNTEWANVEAEIKTILGEGFIVKCDNLVCLNRNPSTQDKMVEVVKIHLE